MGQALPSSVLSAADYLAWEQQQSERHEFVDGEIFAMAGAGDAHVTVAGNVYMGLRQHLSGGPCRTYISDMRAHVAAANCYFYPDVLVTCSEQDRASDLFKSEPKLIVEVLSSSTAAYDRGAKFAAYRQNPALQEYALIDPDARTCDVYRKGADGLWVLHPFASDEGLAFASVGLELSAAQLYADVLDS